MPATPLLALPVPCYTALANNLCRLFKDYAMLSGLRRAEPLSNVDAAWLNMEDPTNLMMITGVLTFDEPLDFARLKATLQHRFLRFKRFRQKVLRPRTPFGKPAWINDPDFDLAYHLQRIPLPLGSDPSMLRTVVNTLMSTQLDFSRPLWQIHLIENYGSGCALLTRLHHAIADGISLMEVLLSIADTDPEAVWPEPTEAEANADHPYYRLVQPAFAAARRAMSTTRQLARNGVKSLTDPQSLRQAARLGLNGATALGRLALREPDPPTVFKGKLGIPKRAAWSEPILLTDIKAIGQAVNGTVNDVILAAMTGALRRYLEGRKQPVKGLNFRAAVPVNLRPIESGAALGNRFGLVFLPLPIGLVDPVERIAELKRRMNALKDSPEAMVVLGLLSTIGMTPLQIQETVVGAFGTKATCVMTNVPGPRQPLYFAGRELKSVMFWVPQSGRLGMGVSLISYNGQVRLGVATDVGLAPDPETIIDAFHQEFADFMKLVEPP